MEKSHRSPAEYIASLSSERREEIQHLDGLISELMADEPKALWEGRFWGGSDQQIIGYGTYSYERSDRETIEWFVVGLAAQRHYISIYVNAADADGYLTERFGGKVGKVRVGKSSISFDAIDDIDLDALAHLITEAKHLMAGR